MKKIGIKLINKFTKLKKSRLFLIGGALVVLFLSVSVIVIGKIRQDSKESFTSPSPIPSEVPSPDPSPITEDNIIEDNFVDEELIVDPTPTPTSTPTPTPTPTPTRSPSPSPFVYINPTCAKPVARPSRGEVPFEVVFSPGGHAGTNPIKGYQWDLDGDGAWDVDVTPNAVRRTYYIAGEYQARMRVQDTHGYWSSVCSVKITALNPSQ